MHEEKYKKFLRQMETQNQEFVFANQSIKQNTPVYITYNDNKTQNDNLRKLCRI